MSKQSAVALGTFDGLHIGHTAVITSALRQKESGLVPVTLLFDEHPQAVLGKAPLEILQKSKRAELLSLWGMKTETVRFADICQMTPEAFFTDILLNQLHAGALCCGENYRFGAGGAGDIALLRDLCDANGITLCVSPCVAYEGEPVSSTRIRRAVENGDIKAANAMLGRPFCYRYPVVHGDARGRLIGAPTANQHFDSGFAVPAFGVYAAAVTVNGCRYPGVTNIGVRPTFDGRELRSETHIIGFCGDIYGQTIEIGLLNRIRGEIRFDSMEALAAQIAADKERSVAEYREKED